MNARLFHLTVSLSLCTLLSSSFADARRDSNQQVVSIFGTPHLSLSGKKLSREHHEAAIAALVDFRPTVICVEVDPGERVQAMALNPSKFGEVTLVYSMASVRLGVEQQQRAMMTPSEASRKLDELYRISHTSILDRLQLIQLQLAAAETWSAVLNWTQLSSAERTAAANKLGKSALGELERLATASNEIAQLAVPAASRLGHRRLCSVDKIGVELEVSKLSDALTPLLTSESVGQQVDKLNRLERDAWEPQDQCSLLRALNWYNSTSFEDADKSLQWSIFLQGGRFHSAASRRLALWHARNAAIVSELLANSAQPDGERTLLLIGASHRPFIERIIASLEGVSLQPSSTYLQTQLQRNCAIEQGQNSIPQSPEVPKH